MPLDLIEPHRHRPALEGLSSAGRFLDITSKEQWRVYQNPVRQDLLQYDGNIFAIGFPSSFAFAELSAACQQAIGVFSFVPCCFADFIKDSNALCSVGCSI